MEQDSLARIPLELKGSVTFFSDGDLWQYAPVWDDKLCPVCREHSTGIYQGSHIRLLFFYLQIVDADIIAVNAHPNCRCQLQRVSGYRPPTFGEPVSPNLLL